MLDKIKKSYKKKQHLLDDGVVTVYLTTKAKSKHSISFTFNIVRDGENIRNIHHRVVTSDCDEDEWAYIIEERIPKTKPYRPKKMAITPKEKMFKAIDEVVFKKDSQIFG